MAHIPRSDRSSDRYMATVLKCAPDPIFALDLEGRIISCNDAAIEEFGPSGQDVGRPAALELFHEDAKPDAVAKLRDASAGVRIVKWITFMSNREGARRDCSVSLAPTREDDGAIVGVIMIARDITWRQILHAEALEAVVAQRDLLLREVYHRVNNNMQVMDALAAIEMRRVADPRVKEWLGQLRQRIHAIGLAHQQLMVSDDLETIELAFFFRELVEKISATQLDGRQVELNVERGHIRLGIDVAVPLGLIVTELLNNAFKHGSPAQGPARVSLGFEHNGARGAVTISDNGDAHDGHRRLLAGTGTGGRFVKGLVKQIKGEMRAGFCRGTRLVVEFPFAARH